MAGENINDNNETASEAPEKIEAKVLETPPAPPIIEIKETDNDPPLCGRTEHGGRIENTALTKKQEKDLANAKVQAMIRDTAPSALNTIIDIMRSPEVKDETRLKAAQDILDRGLGKAKQTVDNEVKGGIQIKLSSALEEYCE